VKFKISFFKPKINSIGNQKQAACQNYMVLDLNLF